MHVFSLPRVCMLHAIVGYPLIISQAWLIQPQFSPTCPINQVCRAPGLPPRSECCLSAQGMDAPLNQGITRSMSPAPKNATNQIGLFEARLLHQASHTTH